MKNRDSEGKFQKNRFAVILSRPENPENVGLVARSMKNTGFGDLRVVGISSLENKAFVTAVHAREILDNARFYSSVADAVRNLDIVFAATAKSRKNFSLIPMEDALNKISGFPGTTRIGFLFGNERTGLTSGELLHSNFRFKIPQSGVQPPYNLASAVLITLFSLFSRKEPVADIAYGQPLSRKEQEECVRRILLNLEKKGFSHKSNKKHVEEIVSDLLGRLTMTSEDRNLLLALFSKGIR
ncbi:MAG: RNA methyltransferase [Candidatus Aminicenantes bacterium]